MAQTVSFRQAAVVRTGGLVTLVNAADFAGPLRIQVENVGLYPLLVHRGSNGAGGSFFLNAGRRIEFKVDAPVTLMITPITVGDDRGATLDYSVMASAVIEGENP